MGSPIQPLTFTGISQYSSDFQQILNRAVQVASIPLQQLQNQQSNIQQEQTLASTLSSAVADLGTSVGALGTLGSTGALVAQSTDSSKVTATVTGATSNASYSITNISSVASAASETSLQGYATANSTAVSQTGSLDLVVGSTHNPITLTTQNNNLLGLQNAINSANAGVTATILTTANGDYLSVSANNVGATTLQLNDDPSGSNKNLLTNQNQGSNSVFDLNGVPVSEPGTQINNVIPGLTLTINGTTSANETVGITLQPDATQLTSALQNLVSAYNTVANQVNAQVGSNAGLLTGNSIIYDVRGAMMSLVNFYTPGKAVASLADLGISLSQSGQMSFDPTQLNSMSSSQLVAAFQFLGSATTGLGGLQSLFTQISDPITGSIQAQQNDWTTANQRITNQISTLTDQINTMQTNLNQQLAAADALVADLQSQQNILTSSIQGLDYTTYGQQILQQQGL